MQTNDDERHLTPPVQALSNQKYRELSEEFSDVGLMTGTARLGSPGLCLLEKKYMKFSCTTLPSPTFTALKI